MTACWYPAATPGDCHYQSGNYRTRRRFAVTSKMLERMGVDPRRVQASWVSASEGGKFVEVVNKLINDIKEIGPNELFADGKQQQPVKN